MTKITLVKILVTIVSITYTNGQIFCIIKDKITYKEITLLAVRKFLKKVRVKGKVVVISTVLGIMIFFSGVENVDAMGLTRMPQAPIMRLDNKIVSTKFVPSNVRLYIQK
jgi:hypothetical protein